MSDTPKLTDAVEGDSVHRLVHPVHPWPDYDENADPSEDETAMLFRLEHMANPETTCQDIADKLNAKFGHDRTADEVQEKLWIGN